VGNIKLIHKNDNLAKKVRLFYAIFSILFLSIGFLIYLLFRDSKLLFFDWINFNVSKNIVLNINNNVNNIILYNLPDGLWILSGIMFIRIIWFNKIKLCNIYIISFSFIAIILEILQLLPYIPGTFDILDIITMISFVLFEQLIFYFKEILLL